MQSFESGPSPAIPILVNGLLVTGDSDSLRVFDCSENCSQTSSIGVPVNGEIGFSYNAMITVGRNNADGGWKSYQLYDGKFLEHYRGYETNFSTYTTTYPVIFLDGKQEALVLANDAGVLAVYVDAEYNPNWLGPCTSGDMTLQKQLVAFVYLMMIAVPLVWLNLTNPQLFTKIATTLLLIMAILAIPQLSIDWSKGVDDVLSNESDEDQSQWNDEWPNEWLGTQVVVFELQGQTISSGGYFGHGDVYSLTQMAAQDLGIELEVEQTDIGVYVHSIDGQAGEGWEFFIDAKRASLSADNSQVESDSIIVWKLA